MTNLIWKEERQRLENEPSVAEKRIIKCLNKIKIRYYREVKFEGLIGRKGFSLYFDFYIPSKNLIIEYDGTHHLTDELTIEHDKLKNEFCKNHKIKIRRLNNKEWTLIEKIIKALIRNVYEVVEEKNDITVKKKPTKTKEKLEEEKLIREKKLADKLECKQYKRMRGEKIPKAIIEKVKVPDKFSNRFTYSKI